MCYVEVKSFQFKTLSTSVLLELSEPNKAFNYQTTVFVSSYRKTIFYIWLVKNGTFVGAQKPHRFYRYVANETIFKICWLEVVVVC